MLEKKPYACKYCDKKFSRSQIEKRDEMIHAGEKPYACRYCDKKFHNLKLQRNIGSMLEKNYMLADIVTKFFHNLKLKREMR